MRFGSVATGSPPGVSLSPSCDPLYRAAALNLFPFLKATTVSNSSVVNRRTFQWRQAHSGYTLIHLWNKGASGRWIWIRHALHLIAHVSTNIIDQLLRRKLTPVMSMNNTSVDEQFEYGLLHEKWPVIATSPMDAIHRRAKNWIRRHGVQSGTGLGCVRLSQSPAHNEWKFT
jgi:hypothetical protein